MTNGNKLASLDALRGLAILLVIIAHFFADVTGTETSVAFGNAGVILFFYLSGFLMDRTLHQDSHIVRYAIRRVFRILPMYWVSLILVAATTDGWSFPQLASNATLTAPAFGYERMLGVYWTLYIEVLFYCVAPVLNRLGARLLVVSTFAALGLLAVIAALRTSGAGAPFYLLFCLGGMQIGAWHRGALSTLQLSCCLLAVFISAHFLMNVDLLGLIAFLCAALAVAGSRFSLVAPPLVFLGAVSYSWYLLHSIFGYQLMTSPLPQQLALLIGAVGTLALSYVTYRSIELPLIGFGKTLLARTRIPDRSSSI